MFYIIYLLGAGFLLVKGIGFDRIFTNYWEFFSMLFVLLPCVLILFCTKSLKAFGRAFLFAFGKKADSLYSYRESFRAVRMVMEVSAVFGGIGFLAGMINGIRSLDFSTPDAFGWMLMNASVAMLSLFYPLVICVILLPVCWMLKKYMAE